jgi:ribonuclease Z
MQWFLQEGRDADLLIHECYLSVEQFIELKNYDPERARIIATVIHTPPSACGKIFSKLKPGMAIAYHTFNDFNTAPDIIAGIRESYDGPLTLADDLLVWNVNEGGVTVRRVIATDEPLPAAPPTPAGPPDKSERTPRSKWLNEGRVNLLD